MTATLLFWTLFLGMAYGGLLGPCIYRLPRGISLVTGVSFCPTCQTRFHFPYDTPFLGYLLVRGRCRSCHAPISLRYLLLESAGVLTMVTLFLKFRFFVNEEVTLDSALFSSLWFGFYLLALLIVIGIQWTRREPPLGFLLAATIIGFFGMGFPESLLDFRWIDSQRFHTIALVTVSTAFSIGVILFVSILAHQLWEADPLHTDLAILCLAFLFVGWLTAIFLLTVWRITRFGSNTKFSFFSIIALTGSVVAVLIR